MNYFNYFTEIEEHFQKARQTGGFLLSPLDWALIESWKQSEIPLEAALKGIDRAFEKYHKRKRKFRNVNSLAYCTQEVVEAAREMAEGGSREERKSAEGGFAPAELERFFRDNAAAVRRAAADSPDTQKGVFVEVAESLEKLAGAASDSGLESDLEADLEAIEQRLTVLEERLIAAITGARSEDDLLAARQEMEGRLAPYRRKMSADQLALLEKQYLQRNCLERAGVPRLSLFYLR